MTNLSDPTIDLAAYMRDVGERARAAARVLARASTQAKNAALEATAVAIERDAKRLLAANAEDVSSARVAGEDAAFVDRLRLKQATITAMAEGLRQIGALPDPVGELSDLKYRPTGIQVGRMRVPLGVVGIVYESRPNVTADASGLCLKSGNACILRGGSEAFRSNQACGCPIFLKTLCRSLVRPTAPWSACWPRWIAMSTCSCRAEARH